MPRLHLVSRRFRRLGYRSLTMAAAVHFVLVSIAAPAHADGGVNTGQPGSTCAASDGGLSYSSPGPGISTTAIGVAPAYYELGQPAGAFLGQPAKGLMIAIHGGGWYVVGKGAVAATRPMADIWRNRGWATLNITYRACAQSVPDVVWFHDAARQLVGSTFPLCVFGSSAGAHLALMMSSFRPDVGCVIGEGAPTNLLTMPNETAYNPNTQRSDQTDGPAWSYNLAVAAFGSSQLDALSPARHPGSARLFLATAQQDEFIPWAQAQDMVSAVQAAFPGSYADTEQLGAGTAPVKFTHVSASQGTGVSQSAYNDYLVRQLKAVAPMVAPTGVTNPVINDIRALPSLGGYSIGDEEFDATLTPTQTQALVSGRTALGAGQSFKLVSCAAYYDPVLSPKSTCNQSFVDTRGKSGTTTAPIPTVTTAWARPAPGTGTGFAYGVVWVYSLDVNNQWVLSATSTPDRSVDAGFFVPAAA